MLCCSHYANGNHLALTVTNVIAIGAAALATITLLALSILILATATPVAASLIAIGLGVKTLSFIALGCTLGFLAAKIAATVFSCKLIQSEDAAQQALTAQHGVYNTAAAAFNLAQTGLAAAQQQMAQAVAAATQLPAQVNQAVAGIGQTSKQFRDDLATATQAHREAKTAYDKATSQHKVNIDELDHATRDFNLVTNTLKDTLTNLGVAVDQLPKKTVDKVQHAGSSNPSTLLPASVSGSLATSTASSTHTTTHVSHKPAEVVAEKKAEPNPASPPRKASLSAVVPAITVDTVGQPIKTEEDKKSARRHSVGDLTKKFEVEAKKEKEKS